MSQYFSGANRRGELQELKEELNSADYDRMKEAIKRVIALMTLGKDLSPLFHSVVKCLEINDIEIKKLVYLYIINYSRNRPTDAIMVVHLFRKDMNNRTSPLIRALAVRTMGCLRVAQLNEYLIEPLKEALVDSDPYVRKTAVLCIPKVYEINAEDVEQKGIIKLLQKMLGKEDNAYVISNLVMTLVELSQLKGVNLLIINQRVIEKIMLALNEAIEWGQVFILDSLVHYVPSNQEETEQIIERILPRLNHINPAVVLSAVKVVVRYMDHIDNKDAIKILCQKVSSPLVHLLSSPPEIEYIALRNIRFLLQKQPLLLRSEIKHFFSNYDEPHFIRIEKLTILTQLCTKRNSEVILRELHEYARDIDDQIARQAIKCIGQIATRVDVTGDKTIKALMNIVKNSSTQTHILNEVAVTLSDILRKYPQKYVKDDCVKIMVGKIKEVNEPKSLAAVVWMLGEYSEKIDKASEIFQEVAEGFKDAERVVQKQILTCSVKLFLKDPDDMEETIQEILECSTEEIENPDIRDRGYIYWRLLSEYPDETKEIVLSDKPQLKSSKIIFDKKLVENLIDHVSMVSSVYHKTPNQIFDKIKYSKRMVKQNTSPTKSTPKKEKSVKKKKKQDSSDEEEEVKPRKVSKKKQKVKQEDIIDLIGMGEEDDQQEGNMNLFGEEEKEEEEQQGPKKVPLELFCDHDTKGKKGKSGIQVKAAFVLDENQKIQLNLKINNQTGKTLNSFKFQIKPNYFAVDLEKVPSLEINDNETKSFSIPSKQAKKRNQQQPGAPLKFTVGMKCNHDVFFFDIHCMFHILLQSDVEIGKSEFKKVWKKIGLDNEMTFELEKLDSKLPLAGLEDNLKELLKQNNIFFTASRKKKNKCKISIQISYYKIVVAYFNAKSLQDIVFLVEVVVPLGANEENQCEINCRSQEKEIVPLFLQCMSFILS